jgi:DNA-binding transcriptional regulator YiaG
MACDIKGRCVSKMDYPAPERIGDERRNAKLTQTQAAALVHSSLRGWQQWEAGHRKMHPAFWELFLYKVGLDNLNLVEADGTHEG